MALIPKKPVQFCRYAERDYLIRYWDGSYWIFEIGESHELLDMVRTGGVRLIGGGGLFPPGGRRSRHQPQSVRALLVSVVEAYLRATK